MVYHADGNVIKLNNLKGKTDNMKLSTKRKIYYTSVITALVVILCCAVVINRTLVNTPEFDVEQISSEAGVPVSAYMAYTKADENLVVGIAEEEDDVAKIISFVQNISFGEPLQDSESQTVVPDAWIVFYDDQNRIASRLNIYDGGKVMWYDGERYECTPEVVQQLMSYCDENATEQEETEANENPSVEELPEGKND